MASREKVKWTSVLLWWQIGKGSDALWGQQRLLSPWDLNGSGCFTCTTNPRFCHGFRKSFSFCTSLGWQQPRWWVLFIEHFSQLGRLLGTLQEIIQCLGDSYYCSHFKEIEVTNGIGGGARIWTQQCYSDVWAFPGENKAKMLGQVGGLLSVTWCRQPGLAPGISLGLWRCPSKLSQNPGPREDRDRKEEEESRAWRLDQGWTLGSFSSKRLPAM